MVDSVQQPDAGASNESYNSSNAVATDMCKDAFTRYSQGNFKLCKESLEQLKKVQENVIASSVNSRDPMLIEEDKMTRIR